METVKHPFIVDDRVNNVLLQYHNSYVMSHKKSSIHITDMQYSNKI